MDSHPAIRRRWRAERQTASDAVPQETAGAASILIVVTDDPGFVEPRVAPETRIQRWSVRSPGTQSNYFDGDPTNPLTYGWVRALPDLNAIVALSDPAATRAATAAILGVNPGAGVLMVGDARGPMPSSAVVRWLDSRAALAGECERELWRIETQKRVRALRTFVAGTGVVPILVHQDPDPDALASAFAMRALLGRRPDAAPIVTFDAMTRPENRRMAELLDIAVIQVTPAELTGFERVICTDTQPRDVFSRARTHLAIVDHHPLELERPVEFCDVRPHYGATASIMTEYLRSEDERKIGARLATALVYGVRTDTDDLSRGVSAGDVEAYTFLLERADLTLLGRIERPALSDESARAYGHALAGLMVRDDLAVAYLGGIPIEHAHLLADAADFCLAIEQATWAAVAAVLEGQLVVTLRHLGGDPGAGDLARALSQGSGSGGGHATMARAVLPMNEWGIPLDAPLEVGCAVLLERISASLARLRS